MESKHDSLKVAGLFQLALFRKGLMIFLQTRCEIFNENHENDK
jgi:hypothetical protein